MHQSLQPGVLQRLGQCLGGEGRRVDDHPAAAVVYLEDSHAVATVASVHALVLLEQLGHLGRDAALVVPLLLCQGIVDDDALRLQLVVEALEGWLGILGGVEAQQDVLPAVLVGPLGMPATTGCLCCEADMGGVYCRQAYGAGSRHRCVCAVAGAWGQY
jgi:hypothetical protein